jgi:spore coat polysaccharide biosynthesis predicted glycosyltransferase SpsG
LKKIQKKIQDNVTRKAVLIKVQTQLTKRQQIMNKTLNADAMAMALGKKSRSFFGSGFLFVQLEIFFGDSE